MIPPCVRYHNFLTNCNSSDKNQSCPCVDNFLRVLELICKKNPIVFLNLIKKKLQTP